MHEMFDSNFSLFSNNSHSQPQETIRTMKDFLKKHASNIRHRLERPRENVSHERCTMQLKPMDESSGSSIFEKDHFKKPNKYRHRNKNRKDSSMNYNNRKGSTSSESILVGLQDVINFCGLLSPSENKIVLNEPIVDTPKGKKIRRRSKLCSYNQKYQVMTSSTDSVKDDVFDTFPTSSTKSEIINEKSESEANTPSAQDISEREDKPREYIKCEENPCDVDECCVKSKENIPCVRIETPGEKDVCYRYKCRSSLAAKCFPPIELPPCNSLCEMCSSDSKTNGTGDAPCKCISSKPSLLGHSQICEPEYKFPPGGPKRFSRDKRNLSLPLPPVVQPVVGICTHDQCAKHVSVMYAVVKITEFDTFSVYEVMKPSRNKPKAIPDCIKEIFVKKTDDL